MSTRAYLIDSVTRHHILVQRYANGNFKKVAKYLRKAIKTAKRSLENGYLTRYGTKRYNSEIEALRGQLSDVYSAMSDQFGLELNSFAEYEETFNHKLLGAVTIRAQLNRPAVETIYRAAMWEPQELTRGKGVQRINLKGALDKFGTSKAADIIGDIQAGAALGETREQVAKRLDATHNMQRQQARTLVNTATNSISNEARQQSLEANSDILIGWRWISTLDSHTTPVCRARDNKVFGWDDPRPPAHWNCRSTTIPEIDPKYQREIKGSTRPAVVNGEVQHVDSKTTYESWLKRQPASWQREVLGPSRYKLFSKGKLSLDKFIDSNGNTLTLEQLKQREPMAFERAGL
ncbi:phage head morphogenesis protein [Carnimonas bestiolae]|uniref:phage head morphogenesis protein n=1 Tax=Carnimonas bestiolae TaxID=3402172 RepID=UPI003EDC06EF